MTQKQIWQTVALDLKRAANYSASGNENKALYYLKEAKSLYQRLKKTKSMKKIKSFIKFAGKPEDVLLGASLISDRI
jgi:hypothetical protein